MLGIDLTDTSQDVALQSEIDAVSLGIANYCDRGLVVQTYRDQYSKPLLRWGEPLRAQEYPIVIDTAATPATPKLTVTVDGTVLDPTLYNLDPNTGRIFLLDGVWSGMMILLDYTAGYDPIPADLQDAANDWLIGRWKARQRDPTVQSEAVFDVLTVTYTQQSAQTEIGPPISTRSWLAAYKRWTV